ncbi:MAG: ABC transporter ATP-binding protein [Muribaculaceae bacterium]|nr:ABC transporter ATP-binding protein [Muribaculaceae bacterium]
MEDILQVEHVTKRFTGHTALDDVSLSVPTGKIYGLLGPNGAGKTTLIRIINHITAPDEGRVLFQGTPLTEKDVAHIGYLPEERGLYKKMKVGEQAMFFARLKGLKSSQAREELKKWFEKFQISDWWDKKVEELSKGMAQKVQFIVTVLHRPSLLIFDEPFSGFDPINAELLKREILELRDQGATVIFSTHNMDSVERLCDDITLINRSHNILSGNVARIREAHGKDRYRLAFDGNPQELLTNLGARLLSNKVEAIEGNQFKAELHVKPDVERREIIDIVNRTVDLISFDRALPSMNDIFLNTVAEYNRAHNISNELTPVLG